MTLKNTTLLRWKMVHVARKFGAFSRDVDYQRVSMAKLLAVFEGTPMYREALREIYHDRLDMERAKWVLEKIRDGSIEIITSSLSPIGTCGRGGGRDVTSPEHADAAVIDLLKNRIMNDRVLLFCVNCKKWKCMRQVERVPEQPECPLCGSRMVAALKPWEEEEIKIVKKPEKKKTAEEKRRTKRVFQECQSGLELRQDGRNRPGQPGTGAGDGGAGRRKAAEGRAGVLQGYSEGGEGVCQDEEVLGMKRPGFYVDVKSCILSTAICFLPFSYPVSHLSALSAAHISPEPLSDPPSSPAC